MHTHTYSIDIYSKGEIKWLQLPLSNCKVFARIIRISCADFPFYRWFQFSNVRYSRVDRFEEIFSRSGMAHTCMVYDVESIRYVLLETSVFIPFEVNRKMLKNNLLYSTWLIGVGINPNLSILLSECNAAYENVFSFNSHCKKKKKRKEEQKPPCACSFNSAHTHTHTHFHSLYFSIWLPFDVFHFPAWILNVTRSRCKCDYHNNKTHLQNFFFDKYIRTYTHTHYTHWHRHASLLFLKIETKLKN